VWIGLPRENVMPGKLEAMVLESSTTDDRYRPTRRDVVTALAATALSMGPIPALGLIHEQREGDVHMAQTVETLLRENTHGVSLANRTLRSVIRPSQDCGLKMVCSYTFLDPPKK
jgi:hypothetical protein